MAVPQPEPIIPMKALEERSGWESTDPVQAGTEYGRVTQRNGVRNSICIACNLADQQAAKDLAYDRSELYAEIKDYLPQLRDIDNWDPIYNNFTSELPPTVMELATANPSTPPTGLWKPGPLPE